jgi:Fe-S-cluster containining protein
MGATCNGCGHCCDPVLLAKDTWERTLSAVYSVDSIPDHAVANGKFAARWWFGNHTEHASEDGRQWVTIQCPFFNRVLRRCEAYDARPPICSGYPWYNFDVETAIKERPLHPECSYWEDVPVTLRPKP